MPSASSGAGPTSDATRSQCPRTSSPLRRREATPRAPRPPPPARGATSGRRARRRPEPGSRRDRAAQIPTAMPSPPSSGRRGAPAGTRRPGRRLPLVDLDERACGRRLDEREAEQRERRADDDVKSASGARALAGDVDSEPAEGAEEGRLDERDHDPSGMRIRPIPRNSGARVTYMRAAAVRIWPHFRRRATRSGTTGATSSA